MTGGVALVGTVVIVVGGAVNVGEGTVVGVGACLDGGVFVGLAAAELTDSRFAMSAWAPVIAASMPINENSRSASESTATRA